MMKRSTLHLICSLFVLAVVVCAGCDFTVDNDSAQSSNSQSSNSETGDNDDQKPADSKASDDNEKPVNTKPTFVDLLPEDGNLKEGLAKHAKLAAAKGQRAFIYGCSTILPPSVAINNSLENPLMQAAFAETYIIRLDVHEWGAPGADVLLKEASVSLNKCPVFMAVTQEGTAAGPQLASDAWEENSPDNMAPKLKAFFQEE